MPTPPRTQYNRNITFRLTGGGPPVVFTFPIKPSELQISSPARVTTTQTLEGVYQDMGGLGVTTIRIQGNTGWRRTTNGADNNGMDGFESMKMLYKDVYQEYHRRISSSVNPEDVELLLIDDIYDEVYKVSMDDFQPSKSKSNPLLYNYVIPMTVQDAQPNGREPKDLTQLPSVALDSDYIPIAMSEVLNDLAQYAPETYRLYTVQSGDSMQSISYAYFGIATRDWEIMQINDIPPPGVVEAGTVIKIPW